jgi:hypothetical protein
MSLRGSTNPFCTRFFQPGEIPFFFEPPMSLDHLVQNIIRRPPPRAAIVGPHGTGKSTLIQHVLRHTAFQDSGKEVHSITLHSGSHVGSLWQEMCRLLLRCRPGNQSYLIVDGWEQMGTVLQWTVRQLASQRQVPILATSHSLPRYFVQVWCTRVDSPVEEHVLRHMVPAGGVVQVGKVMNSQAWKTSRQRHGQNLRESLFDMYDWYRDQVDVAEPDR